MPSHMDIGAVQNMDADIGAIQNEHGTDLDVSVHDCSDTEDIYGQHE